MFLSNKGAMYSSFETSFGFENYLIQSPNKLLIQHCKLISYNIQINTNFKHQ